MIGKVEKFEPLKYPRIAQLTQRSNQFNLRTIRYTDKEIERIAQDSHYITQYYTLSDKFGDYGLVAVAIVDIQNSEIRSFLMSCRVMGKLIENYVIDDYII